MHERPQSSPWGVEAGVLALAWLEEPLLRRSDARSVATHFDAAWSRFTGHALDKATPRAWLQAIHPEDRARCESIHAEMLGSRMAYRLDYRLRHAILGYRWVMEQAAPVTAAGGRFDGFAHTTVDVHDSTALGERIAERLARKRSLLQSHRAFAAALAGEIERLPVQRVKLMLDAFVALPGEPPRRRSIRRPVAEWLGRVVEDASAALPAGAAPYTLALPAESLEVDFDPALLQLAMANALVCTAWLAEVPIATDVAVLRATRVDGALSVELPALPGSSAFVLLDMALRAFGLPAGQVADAPGAARRWRVALPLADAVPTGAPSEAAGTPL